MNDQIPMTNDQPFQLSTLNFKLSTLNFERFRIRVSSVFHPWPPTEIAF
jgi:hypothetical protein